MKKSNFESYAKEKINQHDSIADMDAIWAGVEAELYPKRDRKVFWLWVLGLSTFVTLSLAGYFLSQQSNTNQYISKVNSTINETKNVELKENHPDTRSKLEAPTNETNPIKPSLENTNKGNPTIKSIQKLIKPSTSQTSILPNAQKTIIAFTDEKQNDQNIDNNSDGLQSITSDQIVRSNSFTPNSPYQHSYLETQTPKTIAAIARRKNEPPVSKIPLLRIPYLVTDNIETSILLQEKIHVVEKPSDSNIIKPKNFRLGVNIASGVAFTKTNLTTNSDTENNIFNARIQSEEDLETLDFDLGVSLKHKSGLYLNTGVNYRITTRSLQFLQEDPDMEPITGLLTLEIDPLTDDPFFKTDFTQNMPSQTPRTLYNTNYLINIPLQLGYQYRWDKWNLGLEAGALFNINTRHEGFIKVSENRFYDLNKDPLSWFKDRLGVGFRGAAYIGYHFNNQYQVTFGPYINTAIKLNESISPVEQTQRGLGLRGSVKYWFH